MNTTDTSKNKSLEHLIETFFKTEQPVDCGKDINTFHTLILQWNKAVQERDEGECNNIEKKIETDVAGICKLDPLIWVQKYAEKGTVPWFIIEDRKAEVLPEHLEEIDNIKKLLYLRKETVEGHSARYVVDERIKKLVRDHNTEITLEELESAPTGTDIETIMAKRIYEENKNHNLYTLSLKWQYNTLPGSKLRALIETCINDAVDSIDPEDITPEKIEEYFEKIEREDRVRRKQKELLVEQLETVVRSSLLVEQETKNQLEGYITDLVNNKNFPNIPSEYEEKSPAEEFIEFLLRNNRTTLCPPAVKALHQKAVEWKDRFNL